MKKLKRYAFGGFEEGDKGKQPRKVDNVPQGYTEEPIDPAYPNRRYYKMESASNSATNIVRPIGTPRKITSAARPSKLNISGQSQIPKHSTQSFLDRVFTETNPTTPVTQQSPVEAFMGDTIADDTGKTIGRLLNRSRNLTVGAGTNDTSQEAAEFMYTQPDVKGAPVDSTRGKFSLNTKELQDIFGTGRVMSQDVSAYKNKGVAKMATGGVVGADMINSLGKPVLDSLMSLLDGTPQYSNQPIINASTMRNMSTPYSNFAFGGTVDDLSEHELYQLQQEADEQGITLEELLQQKQDEETDAMTSDSEADPQEQEGDEDGDDTLANQYDDGNNPDDPVSEYAMGGQSGGRTIEVEDDEVVEHPDGRLVQMDGNTHEEGGIKIHAQEGTKIYSDRLSVDGKTMQERKIRREKNLAKLQKLTVQNASTPLKNTINRTSQIAEMEDQQDMAMQQAASSIYGTPGKHAEGGTVGNDLPWWMQTGQPYQPRLNVPFAAGYREPLSTVSTNTNRSINAPNIKMPATGGLQLDPRLTTPKVNNNVNNGDSASNLGVGDYVGLTGNLFNMFAPMINSNNAAAATKPVMNRYKGFGKDALDANQSAQSAIQTAKTNAQVDINSSTNSAIARNRNGARGINTLRNLDIATNIGANKAKNATESTFSNQLIGLLGQRGQLDNQRDAYVMQGQTQADNANAANLDNYFTNNGQNLVGIGNNIENIGRNLNKARANEDNIDLVGLMSQNGIKLGRKKGKLRIVNS